MPAERVMQAIHDEGEEKGWTRLQTYEAGLPVFHALQDKAKALGLWNLFLWGSTPEVINCCCADVFGCFAAFDLLCSKFFGLAC